MPNFVDPFEVRYLGRLSDQGVLDAEELADSLRGASKLYVSIAHYTMFGFVPKGRYRREFACYARPSQEGSYRQWLLIAAIANEYAVHATIYNKAFGWLFGKLVDSVKQLWTRPGETTKVIEAVAAAMQAQARLDHDVQAQLTTGLVRSNDNLASLMSRLIDTLPLLAEQNRTNGSGFVQPVGKSCDRIHQFPDSDVSTLITEPDAEVIRGGPSMEVEPMATYRVREISEVNRLTGHCVLAVEGMEAPVSGKISDPALSLPNSVYTRALNEQTGCLVHAKAVKKNGMIQKLHISEASLLDSGE